MDVKEPKTIEEQIEYLKEDKRVVFNDISEEDARIILEKYGYINVISPFKYHFAKKEKGRIIKIGNKHCYERNVDFNEYTEKYQSERLIYPTLYESISKFEVTFNAVVSHHIVNYYKINSEEAFDDFISSLKINLLSSKTISSSSKPHMQNEINNFKNSLKKYGSVFICLDRMSLNSIITVYKTCDTRLKKEIFKNLVELNCSLGYSDMLTFDEFLTRLVPIRNCIYHNNSLEILYRYLNIEKKSLRTDSDKRKYKNIVKRLQETKKTT